MIIYLDTETTGLNPGNICQLSYVMQDNGEVKTKNFFFAVDSVEYGAFLVHGFSVEKLAILSKGKRFIDFVDEIDSDFSRADLIVAHNTAFDFNFLTKEFENCGRSFVVKNSFCSMKKMTTICKIKRKNSDGYKYPRLCELTAFLGITDSEILSESKRLFGEKTGYHDARFDTTAVYLAMNKCAKIMEKVDGFKEYLC